MVKSESSVITHCQQTSHEFHTEMTTWGEIYHLHLYQMHVHMNKLISQFNFPNMVLDVL